LDNRRAFKVSVMADLAGGVPLITVWADYI